MIDKKQLYGLIHMGAARLGYKDEAYRDWLFEMTGKRSVKECTWAQLDSVVNMLRACGVLENPRLKAVKGGTGQGNRPTAAQWNMANLLCKQIGMTGCDDERFAAFALRNAKVDHPRFLTRDSMRTLIAGLNAWVANDKKRKASQ